MSVEMFRKILAEGEAGDNVGLLLRGIDKAEVIVPDGRNAFAGLSCSHTLRHLLLATTTHTTTAGGKLLLFRERSYCFRRRKM